MKVLVKTTVLLLILTVTCICTFLPVSAAAGTSLDAQAADGEARADAYDAQINGTQLYHLFGSARGDSDLENAPALRADNQTRSSGMTTPEPEPAPAPTGDPAMLTPYTAPPNTGAEDTHIALIAVTALLAGATAVISKKDRRK